MIKNVQNMSNEIAKNGALPNQETFVDEMHNY